MPFVVDAIPKRFAIGSQAIKRVTYRSAARLEIYPTWLVDDVRHDAMNAVRNVVAVVEKFMKLVGLGLAEDADLDRMAKSDPQLLVVLPPRCISHMVWDDIRIFSSDGGGQFGRPSKANKALDPPLYWLPRALARPPDDVDHVVNMNSRTSSA